MLKTGRKYNIGYNVIAVGKDQRKKIPLWHHIGVLDNYLWNKKLALCFRSMHKVKTVDNLKDFIEKDSRHCHCKWLVQTIMNKIPLWLHLLRIEIKDDLDFTPKRLRMEQEGNREIQDILDPNTIDNRSLERAIWIFGSYSRYKDKKKKKESRLLRTSIKRNRRAITMKNEIYCIVLEPGLEMKQRPTV